jgi:hypothetical protein
MAQKSRATPQHDKTWSDRLVKRAAQAMRRARRRNGETAQQLSDETDRLGLRVSPTVIAKLDSIGHRGSVLNVDELLVLSAALNMPPALLLFPGYPDGEVEFLPGRKATSRQAIEWFSGQGRLPGGDSPTNPGVELVAAVRQQAAEGEELLSLTRMAQGQGVLDDAVARIRQGALDRMLDAGNRITELHKELEGEN